MQGRPPSKNKLTYNDRVNFYHDGHEEGMRVLHSLCATNSAPKVERINALLKRLPERAGEDRSPSFDDRTSKGNTALIFAALKGHKALVLDDKQGIKGNPQYASGPSVVQILLDAKANPNHRNNIGDSALHLAVSAPIVESLIKAKANVNQTNLLGDTPLHLARNNEIAKLLIEAKADVNAKNNEGLTAEEYRALRR
jgi:ankyrin repeat protein